MLVVHFLDVGGGDCTIIEFPYYENPNTQQRLLLGDRILKYRVGMMDINIADGYTHPIKYLFERVQTRNLFRFILTHPHMDHLFGLEDLVKNVNITNFWDINHNFEPDKSSDDWEKYRPHWLQYLKLKESIDRPRYLNNFKRWKDQCDFLVQDGISVLSPTPELEQSAMENTDDNQRVHKACFVLKISYAGKSIILGSDADYECWEDIYQHYKNNLSFLKADILKASHHGHESGYHKEAVTAIAPSYVIISDGKKTDSDYSDVYKNEHNATVLATWERKNYVLSIKENGDIEPKHNEKGKLQTGDLVASATGRR
ncbi:MAG: metallo-beta-lactamase superfamily hydrolase [candidate division Zixibacteria bacterium RBG-1]|nr:MAG: metallo-beta-lactamase superfamily hydrolase [candidate division Zixibacteria bacterium RBG-1]OGC85383.1 MAG: hypothetical protein A2V73_08705 [candidate division Zixibacteria bacterium RBG_19FT_COMBO_42_43]